MHSFFFGKNSKRSIRNIFLDISEERHYSALCLKKRFVSIWPLKCVGLIITQFWSILTGWFWSLSDWRIATVPSPFFNSKSPWEFTAPQKERIVFQPWFFRGWGVYPSQISTLKKTIVTVFPDRNLRLPLLTPQKSRRCRRKFFFQESNLTMEWTTVNELHSYWKRSTTIHPWNMRNISN